MISKTTTMQAKKLVYFWAIVFAVVFSLLAMSTATFAANGVNVYSNELAIEGYDPVAYFTQNKAVKGSSNIITEHQGNKWAFSSEEHKKLFAATPEKYLPQYGGFCAFAASKGSIAPVDPKAWSIVNDKLYLNYSLQVRELWLPNKTQLIVDADKNWPSLMKQVK